MALTRVHLARVANQARAIGGYGLAGLVSRAAPLALLPFLANNLDTVDLELLVVSLASARILSTLLLSGGHLNLMRSHFDSGRDSRNEALLLTLQIVALGSVASIVVPLVVGASWAPVPLLAAAFALLVVATTSYRALERIPAFAAAETIQTSLILVLCALLVIVGIASLSPSTLLGLAGALLALAIVCVRPTLPTSLIRHTRGLERPIHLVASQYKQHLRLIPHFAAGSAMVFAERWLVADSGEDGYLNIYIASIVAGQFVLAITDVVSKWWQPFALQHLSEDESWLRAKLRLCPLLLLLLASAGSAMAVAYIIIAVPEELRSFRIAVVGALAFSCQALYVFLFPQVLHLGQEQLLGLISPLAAALGVATFAGLARTGNLDLLPSGYAIKILIQTAAMFFIASKGWNQQRLKRA